MAKLIEAAKVVLQKVSPHLEGARANSRMSQERLEKAQEQLKTISKSDYEKVKTIAAIVKPLRCVLHKTPDDYEMKGWRNIYFQSDDGTPLEGWYIPAKGGETALGLRSTWMAIPS